MSRWTGLAAALVALATLACEGEPAPGGAPLEPPQSLPAAPAFDLEVLGGDRVRLEDYRGRLLLIDFWATWCAPCVLEIPELNAFYADERDNGVDVLAISIDALEPAEVEEWTRERGVAYPVAFGSEEVAFRYGAEAFPFHVLVSPEGAMLESLPPGYHDREELRALVDRYR